MEMLISKEAWPAFATIVAAIIAGTVSFLVTVLSKEQKTSEFRQAWIDSLRHDLSQYISLIAVLYDVKQHHLQQGKPLNELKNFLVKGDLTDFKNIEATRIKILLRLNPKEHANLIKLINAAYAPEEESVDSAEARKFLDDYTQECQKVLKAEWKRVKRGEPAFWFTKYVLLATIVGLTIVLFTILKVQLSTIVSTEPIEQQTQPHQTGTDRKATPPADANPQSASPTPATAHSSGADRR